MEIKKDFSLLEVCGTYETTAGDRVKIVSSRNISGYLFSYPFVGSNGLSYTDTGIYCMDDDSYSLVKQIEGVSNEA